MGEQPPGTELARGTTQRVLRPDYRSTSAVAACHNEPTKMPYGGASLGIVELGCYAKPRNYPCLMPA